MCLDSFLQILTAIGVSGAIEGDNCTLKKTKVTLGLIVLSNCLLLVSSPSLITTALADN